MLPQFVTGGYNWYSTWFNMVTSSVYFCAMLAKYVCALPLVSALFIRISVVSTLVPLWGNMWVGSRAILYISQQLNLIHHSLERRLVPQQQGQLERESQSTRCTPSDFLCVCRPVFNCLYIFGIVQYWFFIVDAKPLYRDNGLVCEDFYNGDTSAVLLEQINEDTDIQHAKDSRHSLTFSKLGHEGYRNSTWAQLLYPQVSLSRPPVRRTHVKKSTLWHM